MSLIVQEAHSALESACHGACARLRSRVQLWRRYERQLEMVQGAVREADYMVELLTVQGQVDYDRLLKATEKLEVSLVHLHLQDTTRDNGNSLTTIDYDRLKGRET